MDLFSRFKRDYLNYLVSIIIPVLVNAASIPVFKRILGARGYGEFALTFNSVLLLTAALTGWMTQSIIRFYPSFKDKGEFARMTLKLAFRIQVFIFFPILIVSARANHDWLLGLLYASTLFIISLQFTILSLCQSAFLSVKNIFSELIRSVSYFSLALILIYWLPGNEMYALLTAVFISYLLSFLYLRRILFDNLYPATDNDIKDDYKPVLKKFLLYGAPLSLWFVFAYLISYSDKYFMFLFSGAAVQGDYQAMFDLLSKSITVLISPVIISLFPLLSAAWQTGDHHSVKKLIRLIIGIEFAGLCLALITYHWFGAGWLFDLIHVQHTKENHIAGIMVITGTFLWQIAMVVHKKYELLMQTRIILMMVFIASVVQILLYILTDLKSMLLYPGGFLLASGLYLIFVLAGSAVTGRQPRGDARLNQN